MGQKVNPKIFRMGITQNWNARWFVSKQMIPKVLEQDEKIRKFIKKELKDAGIARVSIERTRNVVTVLVDAAKPGMIIGKGGVGVEDVKKKIKNDIIGRFNKADIRITINEVDRVSLNSELVVQSVAADIEKRIPFRRAIKQALSRVQKAGAKGARIKVSGRLNGAEIARRELVAYGKIPLHTLRADIDYSRGIARTTYGVIGIKVWIYKGEVFQKTA